MQLSEPLFAAHNCYNFYFVKTMPLYVYTCPSCGIEVEELRSISKMNDPMACPICQGNCSRDVALFSLGGDTRDAISERGEVGYTPSKRHRAGCPCCVPMNPRAKPAAQIVNDKKQRGHG